MIVFLILKGVEKQGGFSIFSFVYLKIIFDKFSNVCLLWSTIDGVLSKISWIWLLRALKVASRNKKKINLSECFFLGRDWGGGVKYFFTSASTTRNLSLELVFRSNISKTGSVMKIIVRPMILEKFKVLKFLSLKWSL